MCVHLQSSGTRGKRHWAWLISERAMLTCYVWRQVTWPSPFICHLVNSLLAHRRSPLLPSSWCHSIQNYWKYFTVVVIGFVEFNCKHCCWIVVYVSLLLFGESETVHVNNPNQLLSTNIWLCLCKCMWSSYQIGSFGIMWQSAETPIRICLFSINEMNTFLVVVVKFSLLEVHYLNNSDHCVNAVGKFSLWYFKVG